MTNKEELIALLQEKMILLPLNIIYSDFKIYSTDTENEKEQNYASNKEYNSLQVKSISFYKPISRMFTV